MKKIDIEKLAKQYCKKKVKVKKFSDEWQPLSINEMVEFTESIVNKISSNQIIIKSVCSHKGCKRQTRCGDYCGFHCNCRA